MYSGSEFQMEEATAGKARLPTARWRRKLPTGGEQRSTTRSGFISKAVPRDSSEVYAAFISRNAEVASDEWRCHLGWGGRGVCCFCCCRCLLKCIADWVSRVRVVSSITARVSRVLSTSWLIFWMSPFVLKSANLSAVADRTSIASLPVPSH